MRALHALPWIASALAHSVAAVAIIHHYSKAPMNPGVGLGALHAAPIAPIMLLDAAPISTLHHEESPAPADDTPAPAISLALPSVASSIALTPNLDHRPIEPLALQAATIHTAAPATIQASGGSARDVPPSTPSSAEPTAFDSAPQPLGPNAPPAYPEASRRARESGTVLLHLDLDADGRVTNHSIARSSGSARLDAAAAQAVARWRFAPATRAGQPVACSIDLPIEFVLRDRR